MMEGDPWRRGCTPKMQKNVIKRSKRQKNTKKNMQLLNEQASSILNHSSLVFSCLEHIFGAGIKAIKLNVNADLHPKLPKPKARTKRRNDETTKQRKNILCACFFPSPQLYFVIASPALLMSYANPATVHLAYVLGYKLSLRTCNIYHCLSYFTGIYGNAKKHRTT